MIVADTGAVLALIDADDAHHREVLALYEADPDAWVLPWAILPEVEYLLLAHVDERAQRAFVRDIAEGSYAVEWGDEADLARAHEIGEQNPALKLGLVDTIVMAVAERLRAEAIATFDVRHFAAVEIAGTPRLLPRDA